MYYPQSPFLRYPLVRSQIIKRNVIDLEDVIQWLCRAPTVTTYRVNLLKTSVDIFKQRLQEILATKYANPPKVYDLKHLELPEVLCIARTSLQLPQIDLTCKEVIVDSCCGAALLRGAHIYAPGVLAMETGTQLGEQVMVYADLSGQCKKGTNVKYESPEKCFIGVGTTHMQRYQLYNTADKVTNSGVAVEMKSTISGVPPLGDLSGNLALLQNLPSIVCVRVLDPQPGERVLDMCAAPGNKTTHIAEMMRDEGIIVALDKTKTKINYIKEKIERNQLKSVRVFAFDATKAYDKKLFDFDWSASAPPFGGYSFDRILLDAPCSALGNRPVLAVNAMTPKMLQSFPKVQRQLFENAVHLLKEQGILVYSTCTVTEEENECMVAWALQKFPQLQLLDAVPKVGGPGFPDLLLDENERHLVQRFGPQTLNNTDPSIDTVGFFIAKFIKVC